MQDTPLHIKQTLDIDPEINFINWELNVQDVASTIGRTIAGNQGLLGLDLNTTQWNAHALNIIINDEGLQTGDRSTLCGARILGTRCRYDGHADNHRQSEKQNS
jgi:hypothetical protein